MNTSMQDKPLVSVVIPAYNHEQFVAEAIDSVLNQSYSNFELVVIDDGSIDDTAKIAELKARQDSRIRVIRQANGGSHAAINRGMAEARAEWIAILNSDDRWAPNRLVRLMEQAREGAAFVVTGARLIDADGVEITDPKHWWNATLRDFRAKARELGPVDGLLYGNYTASTSNFFFSRQLAQAVGPVRPLRFIPDWDWALRAALHAPARFQFLADEYLLDYRLHGRNSILDGILLGDCEIKRLHRRVLLHMGISPALIASIFRNQRDLRRNWRALGLSSVERFVRDREEDVAELQIENQRFHRYLKDREDEVRQLTEESATLRHFLGEREADVAGLQVENQRILRYLKDREDDVRSLQIQCDAFRTQLEALRELADEAQSSPIWRLVRRLRRKLGIRWL
jgi:glycosyltransferase involved in cell wall biosynthesis